MTVKVIEGDGEVEIQGSAGSVTLQCAVQRDAEEGNLDRVAVEWATEVETDEGAKRLVQVLYAYSHDSYDGTRTMILEDGYVCGPVLDKLLAQIGESGDWRAFVSAAAASSKNGDAIATLLTDDEVIGTSLRGPEML